MLAFAAPITAFVASIVSGVTNFGDGVFFVIVWATLSAVTGDAATFAMDTGILFVSIMQLASLPVVCSFCSLASNHHVPRVSA